MAEERTLGLARATEPTYEEESKEELQRRLELARDSISNTVTEIKENVAHQVQVVKDTLDWREQFKKRPVAWSAGALGVGFVAGYAIAGAFKDDEEDRVHTAAYSAQPLHKSSALDADASQLKAEEDGPGIVERIRDSAAYDSLSKEVASLGNQVVQELSSTAHQVVLPFLLARLKEWLGIDRLQKSSQVIPRGSTPRTDWTDPTGGPKRDSAMGHS